MKRKAVLVFLYALIVFSLLACQSTTSLTSTTTQPVATTTAVPKERTTFKKYDPPITLTQNMVVTAYDAFIEGETIEKNIFTKWAEDTMGIKWQPKWVVQDDRSDMTQLSLAITSQDLPDLVVVNDLSQLMTMVSSGMLLPIDELYEYNTSDLTKYLYEAHNTASFNGLMWSPVTVDGKRYAFPLLSDPMGPATVWYRKDLIDGLGKTTPATLADMELLLDAYKKANPASYPFILSQGYGELEAVSGAYGAYMGIWQDQGQGNLAYSSIQPEMKQALDTMSQWYKKGWIDPEFIAKPTGKAMASFISGSSIATYGAWPYAYVYMTATAANNPDARFDVGTLKGPEGKSGGVMPNSLNTWYAISAKCENPEAILYMLNEMLDSGYRDDAELQSKFTFKYHDDPLQAPTNPEVLKSAMDLPKLTMNYKMPAPGLGSWSYLNNYFLKFYGIRYNQMPGEWIKYHLRIAEEIQKPAPNLIFLLSYQVYTGSIPSVGEVHFKNVANMAELKKAGNYITNRFIGRAPETQLAQGAYLSKLEQEKFARIIMGEDTVASFDDFVSQWKSSGGDKITSEVNAWYASVKK